jgi:hypothetical protein
MQMKIEIGDINNSLVGFDARDVLNFANQVEDFHQMSNVDTAPRAQVFINEAWIEQDMDNSQMVYVTIKCQLMYQNEGMTPVNDSFYFVNHRAKDFGCENHRVSWESKKEKDVMFQGKMVTPQLFLDGVRKLLTKEVSE